MPFVAEALQDMMKDFEKAGLTQKLPKDEKYLHKITPLLGYVDPMELYQSHIDDLMTEYITNYIGANNIFKNILNFKSFLSNFISFIEEKKAPIPITLTSWQRSKNSSIFTSGIAVNLTALQMDDDLQKFDFLSSKVFPYFKKVCVNRGFAISHNSPWVLVADLDSPRMKQYYPLGVLTPAALFERFYTRTYNQDIDLFKNNIIRYYNRFVNLYPHEKNIDFIIIGILT